MKTRFASQTLVAAAITVLPLLNGCTQQNAGTSPTYVTTSSVTPPVTTWTVPTATPSAEPPASVAPAAPEPPAEPVFPANLRISKPLNEVIRLAQSGVDETVILTYVTNSPALFTLGAEEIVYLNDLGIASSVITAMMQHDQALKYAAVPNEESVAAAPTYVNPPQAAPAPDAQPVYVSDNYFYDTLSPYGTWIEVDGYGRCWRPTVAITSSTWRPYCDRGRWVHTDAGWYWMSDYSWGAVAFHYGRWFSHPRWGWCWWPDTVWAPSWVTWRYDNDNCGWAPLPPLACFAPGIGFTYRSRLVGVSFDFELGVGAFTFVPWGRFCDPYPYRHCLPHPRSVAIYNQTTVINNVVIGNNNTVINRGIPTDRVREHTRAEVRTVTLRDEKAKGIHPRQERLERDGRTLVVHRPQLPPTSGANPSIPPGERSTARIAPTRTTEAAVINPSSAPTGNRPEFRNRPERKEIRGAARENENRGSGRASVPNPAAPAAPTVINVPQNQVAPAISERRTRNEEVITTRNRENRATVVRPAEATAPVAPPMPVRTPTPIFSKPVVIETPAYTPTRSVGGGLPPESTTGGNRLNRSTARENPIWSSPASQPNSAASAPSRSRAGVESAPQVQANPPSQPAPSFNRPNVEVRREERINRSEVGERSIRSRSEERSAAPSFTPPAARISPPVIAPAPAPAPTPRPNFTPAPAPAPSAPRMESQPTPSRPEPSRSESRAESRSESKSDSGRSPRNR